MAPFSSLPKLASHPMGFHAIKRKLKILFSIYIMRDSFQREIRRWIRDRGDQLLRYNYPLNSDSVIVDVGGFKGDWAAAMQSKYDPYIYIFEPVKEYYEQCVNRFKENSKISVFNYGLSDADLSIPINVTGDASSVKPGAISGCLEMIRLRTTDEVFKELGLSDIALLKINIEGGEYDLLPCLISTGAVASVAYIQVQFHNFIADCESKKAAISQRLSETHAQTWCYEFVWESWERLNPKS
jgi:FkbM family methyltransferase